MAHPKDKTYGEWMASNQPPAMIHADRILGAHVSHDTQGRPEWVVIQWQNGPGPDYEQMQLDFPNALALLSMLKSIQLDSGVPFPNDPRG
ncbi:MAG: hypothetical protein ACR2JJ_00570 [Sphingomicrobium sp.]